MKGLRIVFMGTPAFAVAGLKALVEEGYNIVTVVTTPDKPAGRGQKLNESAVKIYAVEKGIPVLQPVNLKDEAFYESLRQFNPDLQIVVAFRMLPEKIWSMPPLGTYNLHASLLPRYRGAAPINRAIMNGDSETGVCTFKLKHAIDTGSILFCESVKIGSNMNAGQLHDVLMNLGARLLIKTVNAIEESVITGTALVYTEQNNTEASHAPKISKETCRIDWTNQGQVIVDQIRGLSPYPGAFTFLQNGALKLQLKIFDAGFKQTPHNHTNGFLSTDNKTYFKVACSDGYVELMELQAEGKRRMTTAEFLRGTRLAGNACMLNL